MKTIFRFFSMAAVVAGIAVTGALAQDVCSDVDTPTAQYEKFLGLYNVKPPTEGNVQEAINIGKAFLEKFGACEAWKDQSAFVKPQVARLEKLLIKLADDKMYARFDAAINSDNADELYAAGRDILAKYPDNINIMFVMAIVGPREVGKKNMKYNGESLRYATALLEKIKAGTPFNRKDKSGQDTIGALKYEMTKDNAISELKYSLAYVNFYGQNNKKGAMPYFYEVTQSNGFRKEFPPIYATIGDFYLDEAAPIGVEIAKLIEAIKTAPTEEDKVKINEEVKAKVALFNGYTERAMDAYSRAWKFAKDDTPAGKKYKDGLLATIQDLYKRRFDKDTGVNEWVSTATAKPLPDPTSAVQPVVDPETTTTTTTGGPATASPAVAKKP